MLRFSVNILKVVAMCKIGCRTQLGLPLHRTGLVRHGDRQGREGPRVPPRRHGDAQRGDHHARGPEGARSILSRSGVWSVRIYVQSAVCQVSCCFCYVLGSHWRLRAIIHLTFSVPRNDFDGIAENMEGPGIPIRQQLVNNWLSWAV